MEHYTLASLWIHCKTICVRIQGAIHRSQGLRRHPGAPLTYPESAVTCFSILTFEYGVNPLDRLPIALPLRMGPPPPERKFDPPPAPPLELPCLPPPPPPPREPPPRRPPRDEDLLFLISSSKLTSIVNSLMKFRYKHENFNVHESGTRTTSFFLRNERRKFDNYRTFSTKMADKQTKKHGRWWIHGRHDNGYRMFEQGGGYKQIMDRENPNLSLRWTHCQKNWRHNSNTKVNEPWSLIF